MALPCAYRILLARMETGAARLSARCTREGPSRTGLGDKGETLRVGGPAWDLFLCEVCGGVCHTDTTLLQL